VGEAETTLVVEVAMDGHRFGLYAADVLEILRAATPTPLPGAPQAVSGVLNLRGTLVPVYDVRARFGLQPRPMQATDHLVVANAGRKVAILVEQVHALVPVLTANIAAARDLPTASDGVAGVARMADGILVIFDLRRFLSDVESAQLDAALAS